MSAYDLIVIGGGPGGYVCAIRASQLGLKVACVEGRGKLGGTCLNVGCIPSKALLHASHCYVESTKNFQKMGIDLTSPKINWKRMLDYKDSMIKQNTQGIEFLFKKNKVDYLQGWGSIKSKDTIVINEKEFKAKNIVIATGSEQMSLNDVDIDQSVVFDSTGALELKSIPKSMAIIGAGVIGLEMGSIFSRLGSKVTVIEYLDHILPEMDEEVSFQFQKLLKKQGIEFVLNSSVERVERLKSKARLIYRPKDQNTTEKLLADAVLVATGRKPYTEKLGIENLNIKIDKKGRIIVNDDLQTEHPNIYAIGDVISGPMLAHKAEDEGIAVAERIAGQAGHVNYKVVPSVVYTHPEVAAVGLTEQQLKAKNQTYKIGKFSFMGNGRAKVNFASEGFVKILADSESDRILGAHIVGGSAGDLIHELCVAMEFGASAEDLARTCHAHPTVSEAVREAALACCDGAIHA